MGYQQRALRKEQVSASFVEQFKNLLLGSLTNKFDWYLE